MAVLWDHRANRTHYQVRRAGGSIRLYSNGVFHSQWNPNLARADSVWDLLAYPVCTLSLRSPRMLVLGVGGGAALNRLAQLAPGAHSVGVERDPVHIDVARTWFGVRSRLCLADAVAWVHNYRGAPFDYLVDDLFGHVDGEAARAVVADRAWIGALNALLAPQGTLVINHAERADWRLNHARAVGFRHRVCLSLPLYDNLIGVYRRQPISARVWRETVTRSPVIPRALRPRLVEWATRR
ncbi:MAG: hypothetical protein AAF499_01370 [Pseudomonadota bacterium]